MQEAKTVQRMALPVAGPQFRAVSCLSHLGPNQRKVFALIAAYADAGIVNPPFRELITRTRLWPEAIDRAIDRLIHHGYLAVEWAGEGEPGKRHGRCRNRYTILRVSGPAER